MRWLALAFLLHGAYADWWGDDPDHVFTSPNGKHKLIGTSREKDTRLELAIPQSDRTRWITAVVVYERAAESGDAMRVGIRFLPSGTAEEAYLRDSWMNMQRSTIAAQRED